MTTSTKSRSVDDAEHLDVNFVPFAITTIVAASASFEPLLDTRPIHGLWSCHLADYLKIGIPVLLSISPVAVALLAWPLGDQGRNVSTCP